MRHQWYGDNRDIVKWSVVLNLATERNLKRIVQVAMLCPSIWSKRKKGAPPASPEKMPYLLKNTEPWGLPRNEVVSHFRKLHDIQRLALAAKVQIDVLDEPFKHATRAAYFDSTVATLQKPPFKPLLVFVDPDTGIAPRHPNAKHIRADELRRVYDAAPPSSTILLYQHARRSKWLDETRAEFVAALSLPLNSVEQYYCPDIAHDVAFLAAHKAKDQL